MSGGGGSSVQSNDPWAGQQGHLVNIFKSGKDIYENSPSSYYPGQTYLPWNQLQQSGIDTMLGSIPDQQRLATQTGNLFGTLANATNLNTPLAQRYQGALRSDMAGNIQSAYGSTADDLAALRERQMRDYGVSRNLLTEDLTRNILPGISSDAVGAGMAGSSRQGIAEGLALSNAQNRLSEIGSTQDETMASQMRSSGISLGNLSRDLGTSANLNMANFMAGQYGQGIDAGKAALSLGPTIQGMYGVPGQSLYGIGQQVHDQQMLPMQESIDRYYYNQQAPWNDLNMFSSIVNGIPGGYGTTTQVETSGGSKLGSAAGGAMSGAAAGSAIMPGIGTAVGGLLGALGGYYA